MSPQAAAPSKPEPAAAEPAAAEPTAAQTAPTPSSPHAAMLKAIQSKPENERTTAENQVLRALMIERERAKIMKRIAANRTYLRLMEENDELTDEQADWLDDFYPQKEKGQARTDNDLDRTRKAKALALAGS